VQLPDFDPNTFDILMMILHAQNHSIQRQVDLLLLKNIAILVEKYELHNSVGIFADMWITALKQRNEFPQSFDEGLISWVSITWVFRKPIELRAVTLVAEREAMRGNFRNADKIPGFADLPMPFKLIGRKLRFSE
jgi:hypothetical protein